MFSFLFSPSKRQAILERDKASLQERVNCLSDEVRTLSSALCRTKDEKRAVESKLITICKVIKDVRKKIDDRNAKRS
jgi:septal ring factor EnvC (AmiA/AmiB activator)